MDSEYFKIIYKKYFNVLHAYSLRFVSKGEVAEDIVQEVFLECWDRRRSIDVAESLKPYLYTLTRRKSIDFLRKSESKNLLFSEIETHLDQLFFETLTLDDPIDMREIGQIIEEAILLLPPKCKEVFLLSRESGMKNKQIAESLGLSVKTVEKHITKAIKQIRLALEERGHLSLFIIFFLFFHKT